MTDTPDAKAALMPERLRVMETWPFKSLKVVTDIADVPGSQEYVRADIVASELARREALARDVLRLVAEIERVAPRGSITKRWVDDCKQRALAATEEKP